MKNKINKTLFMRVLLLLMLLVVSSACTENARARNFGGTVTLEIPCGMKVGNITWKKSALWYSTSPMPKGYKPVTHVFQEESSFGLLEGKYILRESKCK
jgi:hypothetical protein